MKKQQFKIGAVVKILLSEDRLVFGRLLYEYGIGIYDYVMPQNEPIPSIDEIINKTIFIYVGVFKAVITKGYYEIIGYKELRKEELDKIPPSFSQDKVDIDNCVIYWHDGKGAQRKADPKECIGLEGPVAWDQESLVKRIEDHYAGRRNLYVELYKVILSKDDPRYLPPPQALRWDFEKQEFYRTDK